MAPNLSTLKKEFIHDIHKIAVDATFTKITAKKGITIYGKRAIESMYNDYAHI